MLFIRTKCNVQIFTVSPFFKLQKQPVNSENEMEDNQQKADKYATFHF